MHQKMLQAAVLLGRYAKGDIDRRGCLGCLIATGYSEQTAIFLLEILENCFDEPYPYKSMPYFPRVESAGEEDHSDEKG